MLKALPKILGWSALIVWFSYIYLFLQYEATRPTISDPVAGRVYVQNNHGHYTYLTEQEENRLHALEFGALGIFLIGALADHFERHPEQMREANWVVWRTFEDLFDPSAWCAGFSRIRNGLTWNGISSRLRSMQSVMVGRKRVTFLSDHTASDCSARISGAVGFNTFGPVLGRTSRNKFHLYLTRKDFRNSFAPHLYGRLVSTPYGTLIEADFRMHFFVRVFLTIWFTGLIAITWKLAAALMADSGANVSLGACLAVMLALFGVLLVYWGKRLGADDETQMLAFLRSTLDARLFNALEGYGP